MSDEFDDSRDDFNVDIPTEEESIVYEFDQLFLQGLLKLGLEDDDFCIRLVKYLGFDKDLKNIDIFNLEEFNLIFKMMTESFQLYQKRPSEAQIRQKILDDINDPLKVKSLNQALNLILKTDVSDVDFFKARMVQFVSEVKGVISVKKMNTLLKQKKQKEFHQELIKTVDKVSEISFERNTSFNLNDFDQMYQENKGLGNTSIPTNITKLDRDSLGGVPRGGLTIILSGTNVGKSMFVISLGVNALKAKDLAGINLALKVLHVNLEGRINQVMFRYLSNLAQIPYDKIKRGILTEEEHARMKRIADEYMPRFKIENLAGRFDNTIESLTALCKETYKKFKFDVLIVDYGQLLKTAKSGDEYRHVMADVFRGLDTLSKAFNCAVISPAQATRGAQKEQNASFGGGRVQMKDQKAPVMRSEDISEAFEIARVADMILSLNATEDEKNQNRMRVFLEKQRDGVKNVTYGLHTRFDLCDLITGNYYEANATMQRDPGVTEIIEGFRIIEQKEKGELTLDDQMDNLVEQYKKASKEENSAKADYNSMRNKPDDEKNTDILEQLSQNMNKFANKKSDIVAKAQELIKKLNSKATDVLVKEMETSLRDAKRNGANDEEILKLEKVFNRYSLGIRGKI